MVRSMECSGLSVNPKSMAAQTTRSRGWATARHRRLKRGRIGLAPAARASQDGQARLQCRAVSQVRSGQSPGRYAWRAVMAELSQPAARRVRAVDGPTARVPAGATPSGVTTKPTLRGRDAGSAGAAPGRRSRLALAGWLAGVGLPGDLSRPSRSTVEPGRALRSTPIGVGQVAKHRDVVDVRHRCPRCGSVRATIRRGRRLRSMRSRRGPLSARRRGCQTTTMPSVGRIADRDRLAIRYRRVGRSQRRPSSSVDHGAACMVTLSEEISKVTASRAATVLEDRQADAQVDRQRGAGQHQHDDAQDHAR